jgi:glutathione S-transferase
MNKLLHLPYSPWSERARWALDLGQIPYQHVTYQPIFGEPRLRLALRRLRGNVSVPVLFTDEAGVLADSFAIARYAHERGRGPRLFPGDAAGDAAITRYNELSDRALTAGRVLALRRIRQDDEALRELVPRTLRRALGPVAVTVSRAAIGRTLRKYGGARQSDESALATLRQALTELRRDLAAAPAPSTPAPSIAPAPGTPAAATAAAPAAATAGAAPKCLLGEFSYADVTMAQILTFVSPATTGHLKLRPANRAAFSDAKLAAEFADLLAWRDGIYARYRTPAN